MWERQHSHPVRRCLKNWDPEERVGAVRVRCGEGHSDTLRIKMGCSGLKRVLAPGCPGHVLGIGKGYDGQDRETSDPACVLAVI